MTKQEEMILAHYLQYGSKTDAVRYGYNVKGKPQRHVNSIAQRFFRRPHIRLAVEIERELELQTMRINSRWVLRRAALLADFNIYRFIKTDDQGRAFFDFREATEDDWYCISEFSVKPMQKRGADKDIYKLQEVRLKPYSKIQALELVGKHVEVNAFKNEISHSGEINVHSVDTELYRKVRQQMLDDDDC